MSSWYRKEKEALESPFQKRDTSMTRNGHVYATCYQPAAGEVTSFRNLKTTETTERYVVAIFGSSSFQEHLEEKIISRW